jgi:hypothetical protein
MDAAAEKHVPKAQDYRLKAKPSEIFRRQVYATFRRVDKDFRRFGDNPATISGFRDGPLAPDAHHRPRPPLPLERGGRRRGGDAPAYARCSGASCDPWDLEAIRGQLEVAGAMPAGERRRRVQALAAQVATRDVHWWTSSFLALLSDGGGSG